MAGIRAVVVVSTLLLLAAGVCSAAERLQQSKRIQPLAYRQKYPGRDGAQRKLRFHWIIAACDSRAQAGRLLSTTLLSALLHDLLPYGISISWCKPYDKDAVPSLFYNLRHSAKINFFFMSPALMHLPSTMRSMVSELLIPHMLGLTNMHILWTEDDVLFAPNARMRLEAVVAQIPLPARRQDWILFLYQPGQYGEAKGDWAQQQEDDEGDRSLELHGPIRAEARPRMPAYGTQGMLLSPGMWRLLNTTMVPSMLAGELDRFMRDTSLEEHFIKLQCKDHYGQPPPEQATNNNATCHIFTSWPSQVQHIGMVSGLFSNGSSLSTLFHMASDFPMRVRLPVFDTHNDSRIMGW